MIVRRGPAAVVLGLALSMVGLATAPAAVADGDLSAKGGHVAVVAPTKDTVRCSGGSKVRLRVSSQADGVLVAQGIVWTSGTNKWSWRFVHNSDVSAKGTVKATPGKGRAFQVRRTMVNLVGPDHFVFRAENLGDGEVCRVDVYY